MADRTELLDALRETRLAIAKTRMRLLVQRYPEVTSSDIEPLTDDEIIDIALDRDLQRQRQTLRDLQGDRGDA